MELKVNNGNGVYNGVEILKVMVYIVMVLTKSNGIVMVLKLIKIKILESNKQNNKRIINER